MATEDDPAGGTPAGSRAKTLKFQRVANRMVRGLLRTPLLCRVVGSRLITVYVVGRASGKHYAVPVAYTPDGKSLLVGTPFPWGRNLRTGGVVDIRLKGRRLPVSVEAFSGEAAVVQLYSVMARDNHAFARFNAITLDSAGHPDPEDLHLAWAAGARAFRLTPR